MKEIPAKHENAGEIYQGSFGKEAAVKKLMQEMKGLRLSDDDKMQCINDYIELGANVTESLMRKEIKNYDNAVEEGMLSDKDHKKYMKMFSNRLPFQIYSTVWTLHVDEIRNGNEQEKTLAETQLKNLNDYRNFMEIYFKGI